MLDVDVMPAMLAEALQKRVRLLRRGKGFHQLHFSTGKIIFLNINDQ
jgi:hypothetical protein